jgi:hypothetical protein
VSLLASFQPSRQSARAEWNAASVQEASSATSSLFLSRGIHTRGVCRFRHSAVRACGSSRAPRVTTKPRTARQPRTSRMASRARRPVQALSPSERVRRPHVQSHGVQPHAGVPWLSRATHTSCLAFPTSGRCDGG